jgi:hypothetical protein
MKPARREDDHPWASLGQRTRAEGLDLDTTSLPRAVDWLLDRLANEADRARQKTLAALASLLIQMEAAQLRASPARTPEENPALSQILALEQARRYAALLESPRVFHQPRPEMTEEPELPEPPGVSVFDLVRTLGEILKKVRRRPSSKPPPHPG